MKPHIFLTFCFLGRQSKLGDFKRKQYVLSQVSHISLSTYFTFLGNFLLFRYAVTVSPLLRGNSNRKEEHLKFPADEEIRNHTRLNKIFIRQREKCPNLISISLTQVCFPFSF